MKTYPKTSRLL